MAEQTTQVTDLTDIATTDRPAIGLQARPGDADAIAGRILQAHRQDHPVIVINTGPPDSEPVTVARQLGAEVINFDPHEQDPTIEQRLILAGRQLGFPGIIYHDAPEQAIDIDGSVETLATADSYAIEAQTAPVLDKSPEVMVAIPAYNEAETIGDVVSGAREYADAVVVVDDGSDDGTVATAQAAGATVIEHEHNRGYGGALQTAFDEADRASANHLVTLDGDGQHDPSDIPELVTEQRETGAEIVIGSRFTDAGTTDAPLYRRAGLFVVNAFTNLSLGVVRDTSVIRDAQSGFRAYDRTAIESLTTDAEIADQMGASTDILYHAFHNDYEVREVGTEITYAVDETSSQHPVSHGITLIMNLLRTIEQDRPVTVLGVPGFVLTLLGLGFGYWTFANYITSETFPLGLAVTSVFFVLMGVFAGFTAIILHSLNTHLQS